MEHKAMTFVLLFIFASFSSISAVAPSSASSLNQSLVGPRSVSAVFAFGDSTLDPGNNDFLPTIFQGNHPPYGRDLPPHTPLGRFCNGKLLTDFMVSFLGLKQLLPAYLDPSVTDRELLTGASFASAGTGLDDLTATITNVEHMSTQLNNFQQALGRIQRTVGVPGASQIVGNAVFVIGVGPNDLMFNFYGLPTRRAQYTISSYQDFLLGRLESFVQRLYSLGARKFTIAGLPPIGCLPIQVTGGSLIPGPHLLQRVCVQQQNLDSQAYNAKLQGLLLRLQARLPGTKIAYVDVYNPLLDMINNPFRYGFQESRRGCCGTGLIEMGSLCNPIVPVCPDASKFVFWDAVHPTQKTYQILASILDSTVLPRLLG